MAICEKYVTQGPQNSICRHQFVPCSVISRGMPGIAIMKYWCIELTTDYERHLIA